MGVTPRAGEILTSGALVCVRHLRVTPSAHEPSHATARRAVLIVLAALALALSACSSPPGTGTAATGTLDFAAATVDGGRLDAATLAGTPVVLWFWAPF